MKKLIVGLVLISSTFSFANESSKILVDALDYIDAVQAETVSYDSIKTNMILDQVLDVSQQTSNVDMSNIAMSLHAEMSFLNIRSTKFPTNKYLAAIMSKDSSLVGFDINQKTGTPEEAIEAAAIYINNVVCQKVKFDSSENNKVADSLLQGSQQAASKELSLRAIDLHSEVTSLANVETRNCK